MRVTGLVGARYRYPDRRGTRERLGDEASARSGFVAVTSEMREAKLQASVGELKLVPGFVPDATAARRSWGKGREKAWCFPEPSAAFNSGTISYQPDTLGVEVSIRRNMMICCICLSAATRSDDVREIHHTRPSPVALS